MKQRRITLIMASSAADAFEAFHNHSVRRQWDTLLSHAAVEACYDKVVGSALRGND